MGIFFKKNASISKEKSLPLMQDEKISEPGKILEKISKFAIYLLVFLLPLFFLPWTSNVLDFQKQALLFILVFISLISWLIKIFIEKKLEFNVSSLNIPIVILVLTTGISTLFSLSKYGSFWGWPSNISAGFISIFLFAIFYFLIANLFTKENKVFHLFLILVFSSVLSTVFGMLQLYGKFFLPWDFTKATSFNTIGSVSSLGVFSAVILILIISLALSARRTLKWLLILSGLIVLVPLILINFKVAWMTLLISSACFCFCFSLISIRKKGEINWLIFPMALIILAMFFVFFKFSLPRLPATPIEVSPNQQTTVGIAKNVLKGKSLILGTGPGTFIYDYSKFKPAIINKTLFWNVRFASGASEILDKLITTGVLGILALISIFGVLLWSGIKYLKERENQLKNGTSFLLRLGIFSSFVGVIFSQFFYPANFSLIFLFWIILAGFAALQKEKMKSLEIRPSSSLAVAVSFAFLFVLIFGTGFLFLFAQKYMAEKNYFTALSDWQRNEIDQSIDNIEKAINLNSDLDIYWRDASQIYLAKLRAVLQRKDLSSNEVASRTQVLVSNAVNSAKRATDLNPENVADWNIRGFIYQNTIGLLQGADAWALTVYQRAAELEPTNPDIFTQIGRVYLLKADSFAQQQDEPEKEKNLNLALENFEKALSLKSDYAPAHFQVATVYIREGKMEEAIDKLEAAKQAAPFDTGLAFQLGIIYYNDKQFDKAKAELERAVTLNPDYANARYFLGLIYDREGKKNEAIVQFEKIKELNPGNEEVEKILNNLREGKSALEGIIPSQPPIEEKSPERLEK